MKKGRQFYISIFPSYKNEELFIFFKNYSEDYSYLIYFKDMYCDENFDYIEDNLIRFNKIFKINNEYLKLFEKIEKSYYIDAFNYPDHTKIIKLQNKFINLMKTTIEKDDLQKQINSNQTKTKRKRVI